MQMRFGFEISGFVGIKTCKIDNPDYIYIQIRGESCSSYSLISPVSFYGLHSLWNQPHGSIIKTETITSI